MKDLVKIIKENPGCVATIDNDCWWLCKPMPEGLTDEEQYDFRDDESNMLARDGEVEYLGDGGYGSGCTYGGDILQALAAIVGIKIESV